MTVVGAALIAVIVGAMAWLVLLGARRSADPAPETTEAGDGPPSEHPADS